MVLVVSSITILDNSSDLYFFFSSRCFLFFLFLNNSRCLFMKRGFSSIGLYEPKFRENVGSVLRAAGCYDVSMVAISGI